MLTKKMLSLLKQIDRALSCAVPDHTNKFHLASSLQMKRLRTDTFTFEAAAYDMIKMLYDSKDAPWLADMKVILENDDEIYVSRCVLCALSKKWAKQIELAFEKDPHIITININIPKHTFNEILNLWYNESDWLDAEKALNLAFTMDMEMCSENITASVFKYLEIHLNADLCCFVCTYFDIMPDALKGLIGSVLLKSFEQFDEHALCNFTLEWKMFIWAHKTDITTKNEEKKQLNLNAIETAISSQNPSPRVWDSSEIQWSHMVNLRPRRVEVRIPGLNATGVRKSLYTPRNSYKGAAVYIKPKSFWKIECYNTDSFIAIEDTQLTVFVCTFAKGDVPQHKTFEIKINDILVQADTICLLFNNGNIIVFDASSTEFLTKKKQNIDTGHVNHSSRLVGCGENKFFMSVNDQVYYYTRKSKTDSYEFKCNVETSGNEVEVVCSQTVLVVLYRTDSQGNRNTFLIDLYAIEDTLTHTKKIEFTRHRYPLDVCIHEDKVLLTDNSNYIHILDINEGSFSNIDIGQICTKMTLCASSIFLKVTIKTGHTMSPTVPWIFDIGTKSIIQRFTNNILLANSINYLNGRVLIASNQGFELIQ